MCDSIRISTGFSWTFAYTAVGPSPHNATTVTARTAANSVNCDSMARELLAGNANRHKTNKHINQRWAKRARIRSHCRPHSPPPNTYSSRCPRRGSCNSFPELSAHIAPKTANQSYPWPCRRKSPHRTGRPFRSASSFLESR